jgi:large subunit ribosomal protein L9
MKVILKEKVKNLGNVGEMHSVTAGFARNYLIPRSLAVVADEGNKKMMADQKRSLAKKVDAEKAIAVAGKAKIDGMNITLEKKVGANGKLFGTITTQDLASELEKNGVSVDRRVITIDKAIKQLGSYEVKVKLFSDVEAKFQVKVVMDAIQKEEAQKAAKEAAKKPKKEKKSKKTDEVTEEVATESEE